MMSNTSALTTLSRIKVRANANFNVQASQNVVYQMIDRASLFITAHCRRRFDERIETRFYNNARNARNGLYENDRTLALGQDLKALSIANDAAGDVTNDCIFQPLNADDNSVRAYRSISRKIGMWVSDRSPQIQISGVWGYGGEFNQYTVTTLTLAVNDVDIETNVPLEKNMILRIDNEYMIVQNNVGNIAMVARGALGSTKTSHVSNSVVYLFSPLPTVQSACDDLVLFYIKMNQSQGTTQITIGDTTYPVSTDPTVKMIVDTLAPYRVLQTILSGVRQ